MARTHPLPERVRRYARRVRVNDRPPSGGTIGAERHDRESGPHRDGRQAVKSVRLIASGPATASRRPSSSGNPIQHRPMAKDGAFPGGLAPRSVVFRHRTGLEITHHWTSWPGVQARHKPTPSGALRGRPQPSARQAPRLPGRVIPLPHRELAPVPAARTKARCHGGRSSQPITKGNDH